MTEQVELAAGAPGMMCDCKGVGKVDGDENDSANGEVTVDDGGNTSSSSKEKSRVGRADGEQR